MQWMSAKMFLALKTIDWLGRINKRMIFVTYADVNVLQSFTHIYILQNTTYLIYLRQLIFHVSCLQVRHLVLKTMRNQCGRPVRSILAWNEVNRKKVSWWIPLFILNHANFNGFVKTTLMNSYYVFSKLSNLAAFEGAIFFLITNFEGFKRILPSIPVSMKLLETGYDSAFFQSKKAQNVHEIVLRQGLQT